MGTLEGLTRGKNLWPKLGLSQKWRVEEFVSILRPGTTSGVTDSSSGGDLVKERRERFVCLRNPRVSTHRSRMKWNNVEKYLCSTFKFHSWRALLILTGRTGFYKRMCYINYLYSCQVYT